MLKTTTTIVTTVTLRIVVTKQPTLFTKMAKFFHQFTAILKLETLP